MRSESEVRTRQDVLVRTRSEASGVRADGRRITIPYRRERGDCEMNNAEKIPFSVDISRMIEVLAAQIYPSPFALLRENVQNSFDAILIRKFLGHQFEPRIALTIEPDRIRVVD